MSSHASTNAPSYTTRGILAATALAILLSIVANLIIRSIGLAVVEVPADFLPLATIGPVILFTTVFLAAAGAVFWLITRRAKNPLRTWNVVAWIALMISLLPDIGLLVNPGSAPVGTVSPGAVLILMVMHLVSFAIVMLVLPRFAARI
jgi:hypothetical protein